eukprot:1380240-Pyramimonas_sp.AAC.1
MGHTQELYLSLDKSPCMVKTEISLKRARKVLESIYGAHPHNIKFFTDKSQGTISAQWKQLLRITVSGPGVQPTVEYADDHLQELGMVKDAIKSRVDGALSSTSQPTRWCS